MLVSGHANHYFQCTMNGKPIISTQTKKDLGVFFYSKIKFRQQAASVVAKATQVLAVICHSFVLIDDVTLPHLFNHNNNNWDFRAGRL